jgi:uncharacterized membrane protein
MTSLSEIQTDTGNAGYESSGDRLLEDQRSVWTKIRGETNVGTTERLVSVTAGSIAVLQGLSRGTLPGLVCAAIGGALVYRGATGHCHLYGALDINTAQPEPQSEQDLREELDSRGIHVEQAFLINRSPEDLYQYWRNFQNLPQIMSHLKEVRVDSDRKSHWVAKAPRIAGGSVEWDAEITADEPNTRIAWRSLSGSQIDCTGEIRFAKAMGDRGTEVHVTMEYVPPAGKLGHWVATLFGEAPRRQMRDDLRNFKALMETGEIPTTNGQPRGTCAGQGKRDRSTERFDVSR